MAISHQNHGRIPVAVAVVPGGLNQPFDLRLSQMLARPEVLIGWPSVVGVTSRRRVFAMYFGLLASMTVRIMGVLQTIGQARPGGSAMYLPYAT